jgi:flavodoxin short chain
MKIAVVYWSGTGNTEAMASLFAKAFKGNGNDVEVIQCSDFDLTRIPDFDGFAFGCPAMGNEELEDSEFAPMYDEVEPLLEGEKVILFGSYDWNDGEWMEIWGKRAEDAGLNVLETVIAKDYPDASVEAEIARAAALMA